VEEDVAKNKAQLEEDVAKKKAQLEEDVAYPEDKSALQFLIKSKGSPLGVVSSQNTTLGYHELKAIHINEPALYSLIFGSRKQEAKDFKRWVCTAVLPCIRRKGFFGNFAVTLKARDEELQLALKARDDELQLALKARDDRVLQQLGRQCDRVVSAMQDSLRALIPNFSASLSQAVCFSLAQKFKDLRDDFRAAVSSPTGAFIVALRKAVKLPAMKRTTNPEKFPEEQHATPDEERFVESLSTLLTEELERLASQNSIFHAGGLPPLSYGAWKRCRTLVGSRCLALRQLTGDASKPLLWSSTAGGGRFNGGGQHYVYLKASRSHVGGNAQEYLRRVLKQKLKKSRKSPSVEEHIRQLISSTPPETWPMSSSDVDVFQLDASEEKLGAEMEQ
jgi:hypothetical protein